MRKEFGGHDEKPSLGRRPSRRSSPTPRRPRARGAELIAAAATVAIAERGRFAVAVSGGHAPWRMFELLGEHRDRRGEAVELFQVDERIAPAGDAERNLTHLRREPAPSRRSARCGRCRSSPTTSRPPPPSYDASAARRGSTSSTSGSAPTATPPRWSPATRCSRSRDRRVALTAGEYQGRRRMTLTYSGDRGGGRGAVAGHRRRQARGLRAAPRPRPSIPAGRVELAEPTVVCEAALLPGAEAGALERPRDPLDLGPAGDEELGDQRRLEEPVVDHAWGRESRAASPATTAELTVVVGDHPAVGRAARVLADDDVAELAQGRGEPEAMQLERDRRADLGDRLRGVGDDDEALGRRGDDLLAGVGAAASLDQPAVRRDLVGAVDREVEAVEAVEVLDRDPELAAPARWSRSRWRRSGSRARARRSRAAGGRPSSRSRDRRPCRPRPARPRPRRRAASRRRRSSAHLPRSRSPPCAAAIADVDRVRAMATEREPFDRARPARDQHDPHALDRRDPEGELRAPGHADGARAGRLRALAAASCASTPTTRSGRTATASCSRPATPRCCSTRCFTWPG